MASMPTLTGATHWINSPPLSPATLRGRVVLVNFWTLTCINWLRTAPHVRAWSQAYRDAGLIVLGVHTPEFSFEHDTGLVAQAASARRIAYPIAIDNDYAVWNAFDNRYWPAVYLIGRDGKRRGHHFGEGGYEEVEGALQRLLGIERPFVTARGVGVEAEADWIHLQSPETYLGRARAASSSSGSEEPLRLNHWALSGQWSVQREDVLLRQSGGSIAFRFLARDAHLVLSTSHGQDVPFQVRLDGASPGPDHGVDIDEAGEGVLREGRMYQLVRAAGDLTERLLEVSFSEPGVRAYVFTFG